MPSGWRRCAVGAGVVVLPDNRHHARHVVGVRRAGMGGYWAWIPSRTHRCCLADGHRVPPFDHDPGKARHAPEVERGTVVSTFLLAILGTFITRSGVIQSVHSFAQSPVGVWFGALLVIALSVTSYLVITRLHNWKRRPNSRAC